MQEDQKSPQHASLQSKASIAETQEFWRRRTGVDLTEDEAREVLQNMAAFAALVSEWSATPDPAPCKHKHEG